MKKTHFRLKSIALMCMLCFLLTSNILFAQTATAPSGTGTSGDPYQIATLDNLYWVTQNSSSWSADFIQTADIDASSTSTWDSGNGFSPIGNSTTAFTGKYDGDNFSISNLFIDRSSTDNIGLFGVTQNATITEIELLDVDITGQNSTGALIGDLTGSDSVSNCFSSGTINGNTFVGGLIGSKFIEELTLSFLASSANVTGIESVGGLFGSVYSTTTDSYATGSVSGTNRVGGFAGSAHETPRAIRSYATGLVSGSSSVGGFIGDITDNLTLTDVYVSGSVTGTTNVGGVIGNASPASTYTNVFWNTALSGQASPVGAGGSSGMTSLTTEQMLESANYSGFDFVSTWTIQPFRSFPYLQNLVPDSLPGSSFSIIETPTGSGTSLDPYLISNLSNLRWLSKIDSVWNDSSYFEQTANIDASATSTWDGGAGFTPIGSGSIPFTGNFDGGNFTISGLTINRPSADSVGFFGYADTSMVSNVALVDAQIIGGATSGILAGVMNRSTILNSSSSGTINCDGSCGGLLGRTQAINMSDSYSEASVTGRGNVGGLVAIHSSGGDYMVEWNRVYATGNITVTSTDFAGGLVGQIIGGGIPITITIKNSFASGNVTSDFFTAGFIGFAETVQIENSFSSGLVSGTQNGGFLAFNISATIINSYWNTETSGQANGSSSGLTGLTSAQMVQQSTFSNFDFDTTWAIQEFASFPYLQFNTPDPIPGSSLTVLDTPSGTGTNGDPYQISNVLNLRWLSQNSSAWSDEFIQTADIDASLTADWNSGAGFSPIGNSTTAFTGVYDGDNYQISNLFINRSSEDEIGFFGSTSNATVTKLNLNDVDITGQNSVGALAGVANGGEDFSYTSSSGSVTGTNDVGGMVGTKFDENLAISFLSSSATVTGVDDVGGIIGSMTGFLADSYVTGSVNGTTDVGGLVGLGSETPRIFRSYSTAMVTGDSNVGGLMGRIGDNSRIEDSYSVGQVNGNSTVGGITGSANNGSNYLDVYWNTDLTGQGSAIGSGGSSGISSLTTSQMIDSTNFSGFDFASDTVWAIDQGFSFPYLKDLGDHRMVVAQIDSGEGWRMLGHPGDITYGDFLDPIFTQGYEGSDAGVGFDQNVFFYEESTQSFISPSSADDFVGTNQSSAVNTALNGLLVYLFADDDADGNSDGWPKYLVSPNTTLNDSFTVSLSYTESLPADSAGWNLVSNPYPTSLNWTEVVTNDDITNTFPVAYIWDDSLNAGNGAYRINYGFPLPPGLPQDLIFDGPIPAMQAFWVKATATGAQLNFKPVYQTASEVLFKAPPERPEQAELFWLNFSLEHQGFSDQLTLFEANAQNIQAPKLNTIAYRYAEMAFVMDKHRWASLSLNGFEEENEILIPIALNTTETGSFSLNWNGVEGFGNNWIFSLFDTENNLRIDLSEETTYPFEVTEVVSNKTRFQLWIQQGTSVSNEDELGLLQEFSLAQNYPNPFNPNTNIGFALPENVNVRLEVFDMLGRRVATLVDQRMQAGLHEVTFNARNLASGMYIYRLQAGGNMFTKKLMLIK